MFVVIGHNSVQREISAFYSQTKWFTDLQVQIIQYFFIVALTAAVNHLLLKDPLDRKEIWAVVRPFLFSPSSKGLNVEVPVPAFFLYISSLDSNLRYMKQKNVIHKSPK